MDPNYCDCGVKRRQMFNDVFSCPRCRDLVVVKDHVTMEWTGDIALLLLDEFERYVTKRLLECREMASTDMSGPERPPLRVKRPTEVVLKEQKQDMRECDCCSAPMRAGCNQKCPQCGWVAPCSIE